MKTFMSKSFLIASMILALFYCSNLSAIDDATLNKEINDSQEAVSQWLQLVDAGKYGESWDTGAKSFQFTIKRDEWIKAEEKLRKPLGTTNSRKILDIRYAQDPKNLPAGDYMVFVFDTSFQNREKARELVTLQQGSDGLWRVLTYHVQ